MVKPVYPQIALLPKTGVPGSIVTIAWHFKPRGLGLTVTSPVFLPAPPYFPTPWQIPYPLFFSLLSVQGIQLLNLGLFVKARY